MALFTASQFASVSYDLPVGGGAPANVNDAVTLQLSDGNNVTVCDTLGTRSSSWRTCAPIPSGRCWPLMM